MSRLEIANSGLSTRSGALDLTIRQMKKINTQMEQNYYYLSSISENVIIYTYVENDGIYKYDMQNRKAIQTDFLDLISYLEKNPVNYSIDPDKLFLPSNYLISPFNSTQRFIHDEYFLNGAQQNIKKEIMKSIIGKKQDVFCISANAGTGKTLLMYDIAKTIQEEGMSPIIIHCGKLNLGHSELIKRKWDITPIRDIQAHSISSYIPQHTDVLFIDESQRIRNTQLSIIIKRTIALKIPVIFSYDKKQYLKDGETKDIYEYFQQHAYPELNLIKKTLTNKIRTNEDMASFVTNLFNIGKSNTSLNYDNVTIEYFGNLETAKGYMNYLCRNREWTGITFTESTRNIESISNIANMCSLNAHDVIGQEFNKVVFVMDKNFRYGDNGRLRASSTFYSVEGMLYQIVTRVVNELKIIVLDNPELYVKLLEIKALDKRSNANS